jgi:hypothetical protein
MTAGTIPLTHPLVRAMGACLRELRAVEDADPTWMDTGEKQAALVLVTGAVEQLRALQARLLATTDEVALDAGARNPAAWAELNLRADYRDTARAMRLGEALERRWRVVGESFASGRVNEAQASVLVKVLDALPDGVGPEIRAQAEAHLVEQAAVFGPRELARLGRHVLEVVAPEVAEAEDHRKLLAEERAAGRTTRLTMRVRGDGTTEINARVPDAAAARLKVYLEALSSPRQPGQAAPTDDQARLPYPRRLGEAFCALLERLPRELLPQHGGTATTVMVTLDLDTLRGDLAAAGFAELASGEEITAEQARRLACNAEIVPVVLGGRSEILDQGRGRRLFSAAQRKAMAIRDRRCRADGCTIPAAWCEAHHVHPWSRGGRTDLADGVLLCSWHHHRAHDSRFTTARLPSGDLRFTRRT